MAWRFVASAAALAALLALAAFGDNYVLRLATTVAMYATLAQSWNLIGGFAGYPSFATAAFFGLGAYACGVSQLHGIPVVAAWAAAAAMTALFACALGAAILHLRGHYFAIATLVIADVLGELTNAWTGVTGGGMGINLPLFGGSVDAQARFYFAAMTGAAALALLTTIWIDRAPLGVALRCIEQNEDAAQTIGIDTRRVKIITFAVSSLFAGLAGAIYASWVTYIDPTDVYDVSLSVKPIVMALLGGAGTIVGPLIGTVVYLALEELVWRHSLEFHSGLLGLVVVLLVLFLPGGLRELRNMKPWHLR
jgi:branched-chain amino acid transport system permease protein